MKNARADIVLIEPADNRLGDWKLLPVLGLGYIAAYLEKNGLTPAILDSAFNRLDLNGLAEAAAAFDCRIFGLTALTPKLKNAHRLACMLKKRIPGCTVLIGGPHVTVLPEETLREFPAFDIVVVGEGEHTALELVRALERKSDLHAVKGIAFRDRDKVTVTPRREWITDLDSLPFPAWHLYPRDSLRGMFPFITSRGCPFRCDFCNRATGDTAKFRSAKNVLEEMERLIREFDASYLSFEDEILSFNDTRTNELLDAFIARGYGKRLRWFSQARADMADPVLLKKMKDGGCVTVGVGVESGNQEVLARIHKGISLAQAERAIGLVREAGMKPQAYFILGNRGDTVRTIEETISFATRLNADRTEFAVLIPYPGTEINRLAREGKEGYAQLSDDWDLYDQRLGAMKFTAIGNRRMKLLQIKAYIVFFLKNGRFRDLFRLFWKRRRAFGVQLKRLLFAS